VNSDFKDLLRLFNDNRVKYLIVGGYAVSRHSEPRYTKDLDLWVEADCDNAERVFQALRRFGAPLKELGPGDFTQEGYFYSMGLPPARVDVLMSIKGLTFADAWSRRVESELEGERVPFISREDLIQAKLAAGRPQDLIDAAVLELSKKVAEKLNERERDPDDGADKER